MELKPCTLADKHTLRDLAEKTYRDTFAQDNRPEDIEAYVRDAFSLAQVERELQNEHSSFVLALEDGRPAGYLKLNRAPAQTEPGHDHSLEIQRIYVDRDCQGRGIGQQLLDFAISRAMRENLAYIWLGVWEKNQNALHFYQKNGFSRFGEHIYQLGADAQLDYLMRKELGVSPQTPHAFG